MESLSQQLGNLNLSNDFYVRRDLSNKANFLEKNKTQLRNKLHLQTVPLILEKGSCVFLLSY